MESNFYQNGQLFNPHRANLAESFFRWEQAGRGWQAFDYETDLEPPFSRFCLSQKLAKPTDDGRMPSLFGRLFSNKTAANLLIGDNASVTNGYVRISPQIKPAVRTASFRLYLPNELKISSEQTEQLLKTLAFSTGFISFENIGTKREIIFQITCPEQDKHSVLSQLANHLPNVNFREIEDEITKNFQLDQTEKSLAVDFGLGKEWFIPLPFGKGFATDPLLPLMAPMEQISEGETICLQILMSHVHGAWQRAVQEAIFDRNGKLIFPHLQTALPIIKEKLSRSLFAVQIRLAIHSHSKAKSLEIAKRTSPFFKQFSHQNGNELIPLRNEGLSAEKHLNSLIGRTTFRSGMLLCEQELSGIVRLPSDSIRSEKLKRDENRTKRASDFVTCSTFVLGENIHQGNTKPVSLPEETRTRHLLCLGATGSGKTNALLYFALQDIRQGRGCAVFDVHGDLIDEIVANIPPERCQDVILFDPSDSEFPIGFNPLTAHSEIEKNLLTSDLMGIFRRFSTSWGDVMDAVLANAILAFVESETGGNLFDLKRFLIEKDFRNQFLQTVDDEAVRYFWQTEFPLIKGKPQSSILLRLDTFLRQRLVRNIICQKEKTLNFRHILDNEKILLVKLAQGSLGIENSYLLGTFLLAKLQQTALSRQDSINRPFFAIYADEFSHLICPTISTLLSGIRKFRVGLALFTQNYRQIQESDAEVAASVLANCATRLCFRLGDEDAERFQKGFGFFNAEHLRNLSIGEAIGRIERADFDFNLKVSLVPKIERELAEQRKNAVLQNSRNQFATPKADVERQLYSSQNKAIQPVSNSVIKQEPVGEIILTSPTEETVPAKQINHGKGGKHHQDLQAAIKRVAESYGFPVEVEKSVADGTGFVDVSLEKENLKIACEVSVTTTDYEINNVRKCLDSGYDFVLVVCSQAKKIPLLQKKIDDEISVVQKEQVKILSLPNLLSFLREITLPKDESSRKEKPKGQRMNFTEAGEFFGIGSSTLYRWIREGRVPFYRIGREYQFDRDELVLIGRHDLSGKIKATVKLEPLRIEKVAPKSKKEQNARYRKLLKME